MNPLQSVLLTLQYCLAAFQAACQCKCCEPCTQGQKNIEKAITVINRLLNPAEWLGNNNPATVRYALERNFARAEFCDKPALLQFLREALPMRFQGEDLEVKEIATLAATKQWKLLEYEPGQYVQFISLLQSSLNVIHTLLETTELNMDDLEPSTLQAIRKTASFQRTAANMGFHHNCDVLEESSDYQFERCP